MGPAGPAGLTWRGTWDAAAQYQNGDAVAYQGASYVATAAITGTAPPNGWDVLAAAGAAAPAPTGWTFTLIPASMRTVPAGTGISAPLTKYCSSGKIISGGCTPNASAPSDAATWSYPIFDAVLGWGWACVARQSAAAYYVNVGPIVCATP